MFISVPCLSNVNAVSAHPDASPVLIKQNCFTLLLHLRFMYRNANCVKHSQNCVRLTVKTVKINSIVFKDLMMLYKLFKD